MKYFRMSYDEVVKERSYINILLLNLSIPRYTDKSKKEKFIKEEDTNNYIQDIFFKKR